jgi:hypothetical protein
LNGGSRNSPTRKAREFEINSPVAKKNCFSILSNKSNAPTPSKLLGEKGDRWGSKGKKGEGETKEQQA